VATPENDAFHRLTEAERASHPAGNPHLAKYFSGAATRIQALVRGRTKNSTRIPPSKEKRHEHAPARIRATLIHQGSGGDSARQTV
jgi:hypothetical protein